MCARESNKDSVVGHTKFIASLAATLEQTPFELSDEPSKPSRRGVYKFELILDISLRVSPERVSVGTDEKRSSSSPAQLPALVSECLWETLGESLECRKPRMTIIRGSKRTERKEKQGTGPRGWLPVEGCPSHLHQTLVVDLSISGLCGRKGVCGRGVGYADGLGKDDYEDIRGIIEFLG